MGVLAAAWGGGARDMADGTIPRDKKCTHRMVKSGCSKTGCPSLLLPSPHPLLLALDHLQEGCYWLCQAARQAGVLCSQHARHAISLAGCLSRGGGAFPRHQHRDRPPQLFGCRQCMQRVGLQHAILMLCQNQRAELQGRGRVCRGGESGRGKLPGRELCFPRRGNDSTQAALLSPIAAQ